MSRLIGINRAGSVWIEPHEARDLGNEGLAYRIDFRAEFGDGPRDRAHEVLRASGVRYLPILIWDRGRPRSGADWSDWLAYVQHVVARYPGQRWWQVWNEPNNARVKNTYFGSDVRGWREFMRRTASYIKRFNIGATVIAGGIAVGGHGSRRIANYHRAWFDMHSVVDRVAIHTYCGSASAAASAINEARRVAVQPVWCTELGRKSTVDGEAQQADWFNAVRSKTSGVPLFWFCLQDVPGAFNGFGAWRHDGSHKPVWDDLTARPG